MARIAHRLGTVFAQVNDRQSSVAEADISAYSNAATIRPPVSDQIRQSPNQIGIGRAGLVDEAEYPAHEPVCPDLSC
jgi:hypothetical protein